MLGIYVALALLCGLYLLNLYRLPHDDPVEHLSVPRLVFSMLFLSLGFYLLPGLFKYDTGEKQRPGGSVFAWLDSFLLPDPNENEGGSPRGNSQASVDKGNSRGPLTWGGNLAQGLAEAKDKRRLVFIDFTGLG